jgi:chloramphenicol 3-O phosphotransferase
MTIQVIVLNGGSSSGKSSIARCLQSLFRDPWLTFGVDNLVDAIPPAMQASADGLEFAPDGKITVGPGFEALAAAWYSGLAAMARTGARLILDEAFLSGGQAQERLKIALGGLQVFWVGVRCDPQVAAARETNRGDRVQGMAASQTEMVHRDVLYDMEVETSQSSPQECARLIAAHPRFKSAMSEARSATN